MKRPLCLFWLCLTAALCLRFSLLPPEKEADPANAGYEDGTQIVVSGRLEQKEYRTDRDGNRLPVLCLRDADDARIRMRAELAADAPLPAIGSYVRVAGEYRAFAEATNPGEFDGREYYRILGIAYRIRGARLLAAGGPPDAFRERMFRLREACARILDAHLEARDASVMKAVLLGERSSLEEDISALYRRNGIAHILAVSGLHVSVLGMGVYRLLRRCTLPVPAASCAALICICCYGTMCGTGVSTVRAILMFSLRLCALLIGRTYDTASAAAAAGCLLLMEQPLYVRHSGFLMSFGALMGIGLLLPAMRPLPDDSGRIRLKRRNVRGLRRCAGQIKNAVCSGAAAGAAVGLATLPVYMNCFYTVPVYAVLLNIPVLLLTGALMGSGALVLALHALPFGTFAPAAAAHAILAFYEALCRVAQTLPGSTWYAGRAAVWQVAAYYALLLIFVTVSERLRKRRRRSGGEAVKRRCRRLFREVVRFFLLPSAFLLLSVRTAPELQICFLDVGQGTGIVVRGRDGSYLLDGGSTSGRQVGKYQLIPYLKREGVGALDAVVISHEDSDHISGVLELLDEMRDGGIRVRRLFLPQVAEDEKGEGYRALEQAAECAGVPVDYLHRGQGWQKGAFLFTCLGPPEGLRADGANAHSLILRLQYGAFSALFTGDVEKEGLTALNEALASLPAQARRTDCLSCPHHGSAGTTDETFLSLCRPRVTVISCGRKNRYGHPHPELLERLEAAGTLVCTTAESGAVTIRVHKGGAVIRLDRFLR